MLSMTTDYNCQAGKMMRQLSGGDPLTVRDSHGSSSKTDMLGPEVLEADILEPIAVVGLSFKFPQEATSTQAFWEMMSTRRCAMTEFPADRWNQGAFYHPDPDRYDAVGDKIP